LSRRNLYPTSQFQFQFKTLSVKTARVLVTCNLEVLEARGRPDGSKTLWFKPTNQIVTHTIRKEDWVEALKITADIVAGIVLAAVGLGAGGKFVGALVAKGLSLIASRMILAVLMGLTSGIAYVLINMAKWIAMANDNNFNVFPPIDELLAKGLSRIEWPDSSGFKVRSVDLRKSLRIGLEPQFIA
jgi:hypothetical protein